MYVNWPGNISGWQGHRGCKQPLLPNLQSGAVIFIYTKHLKYSSKGVHAGVAGVAIVTQLHAPGGLCNATVQLDKEMEAISSSTCCSCCVSIPVLLLQGSCVFLLLPLTPPLQRCRVSPFPLAAVEDLSDLGQGKGAGKCVIY